MRSVCGWSDAGAIAVRIMLILVCVILAVSCTGQGQVPPGFTPASSVPDTGLPPVSLTPGSPGAVSTTASVTASSTLVPPPQETPTSTDQPALTPPPAELTSYRLDAVLDYYNHSLVVAEKIRYMNTASDALSSLVMIVESNLWPGSFSLLSITWADGGVVENYALNEDQLDIPLPTALSPGEALSFELKYSLVLPEIPPPSDTYRPQPYGYTSRQVNIVDWYPYLPPYRPGEGWLVHKHWWFGEHQVYEVADFDVNLELAGAVPGLVIAASAPAHMDGEAYSYHLHSARTFAISASDAYVLRSIQVGAVVINSYAFPFDNNAGEQVLQDTADALELYSRLLIPYPHLSLSVVEADFLDGMEYDGLFFLSHGFYDLYDGTPMGYLTFIAAHETAHQWWYGMVGNDQALEPWLDEAMCTYMEHIFYENVYADYPTDSGQSILDWWWYYRVNFYEPSGWLDRSIYDFNQFRPYRDSIYLNGAKFFNDLRSLVGDEAFFTFLKDYARQEQNKVATSADFMTILRAHTDVDLEPLLEQYFESLR